MAILTSLGLNARQTDGYTDFLYLAVGTGSQTEAVGLTALATELVRVAIGARTVAGAVLTLEALLTNAQGNGDLTEWGIFDASSGGNMLAYGTWSTAQTKTSSQGAILIVTDTLSNA